MGGCRRQLRFGSRAAFAFGLCGQVGARGRPDRRFLLPACGSRHGERLRGLRGYRSGWHGPDIRRCAAATARGLRRDVRDAIADARGGCRRNGCPNRFLDALGYGHAVGGRRAGALAMSSRCSFALPGYGLVEPALPIPGLPTPPPLPLRVPPIPGATMPPLGLAIAVPAPPGIGLPTPPIPPVRVPPIPGAALPPLGYSFAEPALPSLGLPALPELPSRPCPLDLAA